VGKGLLLAHSKALGRRRANCDIARWVTCCAVRMCSTVQYRIVLFTAIRKTHTVWVLRREHSKCGPHLYDSLIMAGLIRFWGLLGRW